MWKLLKLKVVYVCLQVSLYETLKGQYIKNGHHLRTFMLFQTCMTLLEHKIIFIHILKKDKKAP